MMTSSVALRITGLIVCALFIWGGSINRGWSGFFWAIPFVVGLVILVWPWPVMYKIAVILTVAIPCGLFAWDKSHNSLLYPPLNNPVTFDSQWGVTNHGDANSLISPDMTHIYTDENIHGVINKHRFSALVSPLTLTLVSVNVSNADFGENRIAVFVDETGNQYEVFEDTLLRGVEQGTVQSKALEGIKSLQSSWSKYLDMLMFWPMLPVIFMKG